jgi:hypothetical protein
VLERFDREEFDAGRRWIRRHSVRFTRA